MAGTGTGRTGAKVVEFEYRGVGVRVDVGVEGDLTCGCEGGWEYKSGEVVCRRGMRGVEMRVGCGVEVSGLMQGWMWLSWVLGGWYAVGALQEACPEAVSVLKEGVDCGAACGVGGGVWGTMGEYETVGGVLEEVIAQGFGVGMGELSGGARGLGALKRLVRGFLPGGVRVGGAGKVWMGGCMEVGVRVVRDEEGLGAIWGLWDGEAGEILLSRGLGGGQLRLVVWHEVCHGLMSQWEGYPSTVGGWISGIGRGMGGFLMDGRNRWLVGGLFGGKETVEELLCTKK